MPLGRLPALLHGAARIVWRFSRPLTVGVRVLLVDDDDRVTLVRHTYQPHWYLPGGGVKKREDLEQAARREAREELGATVGELRLFGVYSSFAEHKSDHVVVFAAREFSVGRPHSLEIAAVESFPLHALPQDASPGTVRRIQDYLARRGPAFGPW